MRLGGTGRVDVVVAQRSSDACRQLGRVVARHQPAVLAVPDQLGHGEGVPPDARQPTGQGLHEDLAEALHPRWHHEQVVGVVEPVDLARTDAPHELDTRGWRLRERPPVGPGHRQGDRPIVLTSEDRERVDDHVAGLDEERGPHEEEAASGSFPHGGWGHGSGRGRPGAGSHHVHLLRRQARDLDEVSSQEVAHGQDARRPLVDLELAGASTFDRGPVEVGEVAPELLRPAVEQTEQDVVAEVLVHEVRGVDDPEVLDLQHRVTVAPHRLPADVPRRRRLPHAEVLPRGDPPPVATPERGGPQREAGGNREVDADVGDGHPVPDPAEGFTQLPGRVRPCAPGVAPPHTGEPELHVSRPDGSARERAAARTHR